MSANRAQVGAGCGYVLFVLLGLAGLGLIVLSAGLLREGRVTTGSALIPAMFGVGLLIVAVASLRWGRRIAADSRAEAARRARFPDQPWKWRKEWQGPAIGTKSGVGVVGLWLFTVFWNLISMPLLGVFLNEARREPAMYVALLFPLAGLGLLAAAVYQTVRWRKYGRARFVPSSLPGVIGGYLGGVIEVPGRVAIEADAKLALVCVRRETRGHGKQRYTVEKVLWEHEERIPREKWLSTASGTRVPVLFYIPAGQADTDDSDRNNEIVWRLSASAPTPGVDFSVQFDVPVFATGETAAPPAPGSPLLEEYRPQVLDEAALAACGVRRTGETFRFGANPMPGTRFTTLVLLTGLVALLAWYARTGVPLAIWAITLIFGLVVALIALDVWSSGYELRIEVADVVVTKRRPWGARVIRVPRREITAVRTAQSLVAGQSRHHRLVLVRAEPAREVVFARHVPGPGKAGAIAELVWREIRKG